MQVRSNTILEKELTVDMSKQLGNGSFGTTYRGEITLNGKKSPAAIKMLDTSKMNATEEAAAEKQIKNEQRLFELLGHADNVIKYYGHIEIKGHFAIVMQFANQGDLAAILAKVSGTNPLSVTNTRYIITDVVNGVSQLHAKDIIHCDLKPQNILITEDDNGNLHAKIADLGLSKVKNEVADNCGSLAYMAPEVLMNKKQGKKSDVYSTSIILWETLAAPKSVTETLKVKTINDVRNKTAFSSSRLPIYNQFSKKVGLWIERSWSQKPSNRPTSAELATAFNALTDEDMQKTYEKKKKTI